MRIITVSYSRKVSDSNYGNQELGLSAELNPSDSPAEAVNCLRDCVDILLSKMVLPEKREVEWATKVSSVAAELSSGDFKATNLTKSDVTKARDIFRRLAAYKRAVNAIGSVDELLIFDEFNGDEQRKIIENHDKLLNDALKAYFPQ